MTSLVVQPGRAGFWLQSDTASYLCLTPLNPSQTTNCPAAITIRLPNLRWTKDLMIGWMTTARKKKIEAGL